MNKPFFSVIIPTYNSAGYIDQCLNSVASQSFRDFEIIIQDGKSTDDTLEKISAFRLHHEAIQMTVVSGKDNGIYDAMNKAVTSCKGQWLYFLGTDDSLYSDDVLARVVNAIKKRSSLDMIYGNVVRIHSGEVHFGRFDFEKLLGYNICHQSIFMKRTVFTRLGKFDLSYKACADWDLNIRLFKAGYKVGYIDLKVANYNENGFSNQFRDEPFFESLYKERKIYYANVWNKVRSLAKRAVNKLSS